MLTQTGIAASVHHILSSQKLLKRQGRREWVRAPVGGIKKSFRPPPTVARGGPTKHIYKKIGNADSELQGEFVLVLKA